MSQEQTSFRTTVIATLTKTVILCNAAAIGAVGLAVVTLASLYTYATILISPQIFQHIHNYPVIDVVAAGVLPLLLLPFWLIGIGILDLAVQIATGSSPLSERFPNSTLVQLFTL